MHPPPSPPPKSATVGGGLDPKVKFFVRKLSLISGVLNKLVKLSALQKWIWGQNLGDVCDFVEKLHFNAIWIIFCKFSESFEELNCENRKLSARIKSPSPFSPSYLLTGKV